MVAAAVAAEAAAAEVVDQLRYARFQLDSDQRQAAHDAYVAADAILLGPLAQDSQQRAPRSTRWRVADAGFEVKRLSCRRSSGLPGSLAAARAAAEPARQAQALKALVASRRVAEEADAQRRPTSLGPGSGGSATWPTRSSPRPLPLGRC
jgi:hypothetical protein